VFAKGRIPFVAGGDHADTIPLLEALSDLGEPVHIVQIDAHPDLHSQYDGNRNSHACVGARALEMEHIATLTGIGIRTFNAVQRQQADRHRGRYFELSAEDCAGTIPEVSHLNENTPVYITLDLDAFDPAFAPGVSHPVPGGLTPRQVLHFLHRSRWRLVGMDAVEVNPSRDEHNRTAILAARLLHEGMGIASRGR
jgi:agmatinase